MKKTILNLSRIIELSANNTTSIEIQEIKKYKKSLITYFKSFYYDEPILMVTSVFNACQYGKIVPSEEFVDAVDDFVNGCDLRSEEEQRYLKENIYFNSIYLKDL